jgi:TonB family protein
MQALFAFIILSFLLGFPAYGQQPEPRVKLNLSGGGDPHSISEAEAKEIRARFLGAIDIPLQLTVSEDAPVSIRKAIVRAAKREKPADLSEKTNLPHNDYAMQAKITIYNESDQKLDGVNFEVRNTEAKHIFYVVWFKLDLSAHKSRDLVIPLMTISGDPGHLTVKAVGARFENNTIWGAFPFPPPARMTAPLPVKTDVDTKPRPLNAPQPRYTEEARMNRVMGAAGLQLEVGVDGSVTDVRVTNALPDGLTEQAIKAARQLRFSPALKNGQPVACWVAAVVEFNLK